jgi:hypothetical protein
MVTLDGYIYFHVWVDCYCLQEHPTSVMRYYPFSRTFRSLSWIAKSFVVFRKRGLSVHDLYYSGVRVEESPCNNPISLSSLRRFLHSTGYVRHAQYPSSFWLLLYQDPDVAALEESVRTVAWLFPITEESKIGKSGSDPEGIALS